MAYKKEMIIEKSLHVIHAKGYNGTSVNDIVTAAEVPKGSFYNYFKSKEDYMVEALKFYYGRGHGTVESLKNKDVDPKKRFELFFGGMIKSLEIYEYKKGCLIGNITQEMSDNNEAIRQTVDSIHNRLEKALQVCVEDGQALGYYTKALTAKQLASFILCSWQGAQLRMKAHGTKEALTNFMDNVTVLLQP